MGRNTADFFDGGAAARTDSTGASQAVVKWDGPNALANQSQEYMNRFTGRTSSSTPYEGTGK